MESNKPKHKPGEQSSYQKMSKFKLDFNKEGAVATDITCIINKTREIIKCLNGIFLSKEKRKQRKITNTNKKIMDWEIKRTMTARGLSDENCNNWGNW